MDVNQALLSSQTWIQMVQKRKESENAKVCNRKENSWPKFWYGPYDNSYSHCHFYCDCILFYWSWKTRSTELNPQKYSTTHSSWQILWIKSITKGCSPLWSKFSVINCCRYTQVALISEVDTCVSFIYWQIVEPVFHVNNLLLIDLTIFRA